MGYIQNTCIRSRSPAVPLDRPGNQSCRTAAQRSTAPLPVHPALGFAVIGGEKCGTTTVAEMLRRHPDVFMPAGEISAFEDPDYGAGGLVNLVRALQPITSRRTTGIHRSSDLHRPECPERIRRHFPTARLVVILRDPVERAISAYFHNIRYGFAALRDVNVGLPAIAAGIDGARLPRSREVLEFGFYHAHLSRYLRIFPRSQILVIPYDDLRTDLEGVLNRLCRFLDLDPQLATVPPTTRMNPGTYSLRQLWLQRQQHRLMFSYAEDGSRLFARQQPLSRVEQRIVALLRALEDWLLERNWLNDRPIVARETEAFLAKLYREDTARLQDLLGIDLSHWRPLRRSDAA